MLHAGVLDMLRVPHVSPNKVCNLPPRNARTRSTRISAQGEKQKEQRRPRAKLLTLDSSVYKPSRSILPTDAEGRDSVLEIGWMRSIRGLGHGEQNHT